MNRFAAYFIIILSSVLGGGSLLLFGAFLIIRPLNIISFNSSEAQVLIWDGFLSLLFFIQHSGMIRPSFSNRLSSIIPPYYYSAIYSIASGIILIIVILLWQISRTTLFQIQGPLQLLPRAICLLGIAGFIWGIRAIGAFDPFGLTPIVVNLRRKQLRSPDLVIRGPYFWVRHPLYFFMLVIIWSVPGMNSDRLLFNVVWTLWIIIGSYLEEKDLVAEFGEKYQLYQKTVPMLFPWKGPVGRGLQIS